MERMMRISGLVALLAATSALAGSMKVHAVRPSEADPAVRAFDEPSYALFDPARASSAPLVLFLTGTGGRPQGADTIISFVAELGYRVIGLEYDDTPAVAEVCPRDPDPDCSARFRRMRVDGEGDFRPVHNPPAEAITRRLEAALARLDRDHPDEGWGQYLQEGHPRWDRIVASGLSQGAGMAAYIAKHHLVRRVVLFSSPWDVTGEDHHPAPWLSEPSRTPPERWFAEYHQRERTAALIRRAYAALGVPQDHVRVFTQDLPPGSPPSSPNPYHVMTIRDVRYAPDWRIMFGAPDEPGAGG